MTSEGIKRRLINNDALFNNIFVIEQNFDIVPNTHPHYGASITYDCGSFVAKWYIAVMRKAVRTQKTSVFRNCNSHFAANERK